MQDITLTDQAGDVWRLADLHDSGVLLTFFRGDW